MAAAPAVNQPVTTHYAAREEMRVTVYERVSVVEGYMAVAISGTGGRFRLERKNNLKTQLSVEVMGLFLSLIEALSLPVTEAHMIDFVGWLNLWGEKGTRNVSSTSIPQYFSAVRHIQMALNFEPVPIFPFF